MLKIIAVGLSGVLILTCMVAFYAFQTGIAVVDVRDKVHGKRVFLPVPVGLVNLGLSMIPGEMLTQVNHDLGPHRKIIQAMAEELENVPDANFVEVETPREHVLVSKSGNNIIVKVETREESVNVRFPIRSTGNVIAKLASLKESD